MRERIKLPAQRRWKPVSISPVACIGSLLLAEAASPLGLFAQGGRAAAAAWFVVGDWRGASICVVRESACHDEDSLYHFSAVANNSRVVSLKADKIVDGKPVTMGAGNCDFDPAKLQITCPLPSASLHFQVSGKEMTGNMTLSNGTIWRTLSLKKLP